MSKTPYVEVSIIPQGLRQEETILKIAEAIDILEQATSGIFSHVRSSIEKQTNRLKKIQERSKVVQAKLDKISGINKATIVFASAKYPGSDIPQDHFCSLLNNPLPLVQREQVEIKSKHENFDPEILKDLCQHFHVKSSSMAVRKNIEVAPEEGLGPLPSNIDSVSSLLLYNTSENLYKKYVMLDPLGVVTKTRQVVEEEATLALDAAPCSMQEEAVEFKGGENYFYSPSPQEVPNLNVPLDLPDLPGIAGDLQFLVDNVALITPSGSALFPDLPAVNTEIMPDSSPPPPPPVPPPFIVAKALAAEEAGPSTQALPSILVPAPPPPPPALTKLLPPPPPPPQPPISSTASTSAPPQAVTQEAGGDARASLMEAIRNAGGKEKAKLRSVLDRKQEAKLMKEEEIKSTGGNLMADLHAKLSLRRKGISGSQPAGSASRGDPLEKIMAMIPPPPVKESDTEDQDDPDADWED